MGDGRARASSTGPSRSTPGESGAALRGLAPAIAAELTRVRGAAGTAAAHPGPRRLPPRARSCSRRTATGSSTSRASRPGRSTSGARIDRRCATSPRCSGRSITSAGVRADARVARTADRIDAPGLDLDGVAPPGPRAVPRRLPARACARRGAPIDVDPALLRAFEIDKETYEFIYASTYLPSLAVGARPRACRDCSRPRVTDRPGAPAAGHPRWAGCPRSAPRRVRARLGSARGTGRRTSSDRSIVFTGLGSSRYAALSIAPRLRARGVNAWVEFASSAQAASPAPDLIVVAISASGRTPEVVDAARRHRGRASSSASRTTRDHRWPVRWTSSCRCSPGRSTPASPAGPFARRLRSSRSWPTV